MSLPTHRTRSAALPRLPLAAALLVGSLALSGCGGSSSKVSSPATSALPPSSSAADTSSAPATDASSSADASDTASAPAVAGLAGVDACTLLTPADFTAATTAFNPTQYPTSTYTLKTVPTKTDVGPAVDQHSACTYHFTGAPGYTGEFTLDVMTVAEYKSLGTIDSPKPIAGLGDEAAIFGERPAVLKGSHGALIANSQGSKAFSTAILRVLVPKL